MSIESERMKIPIPEAADPATRASIAAICDAVEANAALKTLEHAQSAIVGAKDVFGSHVEAVADKTYWVAEMSYSGKVTDVVTKCGSGTATATVYINATALGGTANSVSDTRQSQAHSTANAFAAGDILKLVITGNSTCLEFRYTIKTERT